MRRADITNILWDKMGGRVPSEFIYLMTAKMWVTIRDRFQDANIFYVDNSIDMLTEYMYDR